MELEEEGLVKRCVTELIPYKFCIKVTDQVHSHIHGFENDIKER